MALDFSVLRTCSVIVCLILHVFAEPQSPVDPWIVSFKVIERNCIGNSCKYLLNVRGGEFIGHYSWRLTPKEQSRGGHCDVISPNYELREVNTDQWETQVEVIIPHTEGKTYFCLRHYEKKNSPFGGKWVHQGANLYLEPKNAEQSQSQAEYQSTEQSAVKETAPFLDLLHDIDVNRPNSHKLKSHKIKDIEIYQKDKYIQLEQHENVQSHRVKNVQSHRVIYNNSLLFSNINNSDINDVGSAYNYVKYNTKNVNRHKDNENVVIDSKDAFESWNENAIFLTRKKRSEKAVKLEVKTRKDAYDVDNYGKTDINSEKTTRIERQTNTTDDLLTSYDIVESKIQLENVIDNNKVQENHEDALIKPRKQRQVPEDFTSVRADPPAIIIEGIRVESSEKEPNIVDPGIPSVLANTGVTLRLFGEGLTARTMIAFTADEMAYGDPCKFLVKGAEYMVKPDSLTKRSAVFEIKAPAPIHGAKLFICAKNVRADITDPFKDDAKFLHQGTESFKVLATHNKILPLWVTLILVCICLMFSALFSGLNLGLMSLDRTELKIISNTGTEQERKYARAIMPVRDHGNYLLCSILLGNVAVNSTFTILLDDLTSGLFAVIFSTLAIVMLGEITPQAICSRHGLMVGAKSIMVTKAVMALTAPLAFPVSKLLDYFLGEEIGSIYNRERLKELVKLTTDVNDLDKDEVNIISGALELRKKTVSDVMTKLEDVFMLPISSVLDFETMSEIVKSGYSRIPVYEGARTNIVTVLFIKDLAFVDPDDNTPLRTLCQYYQNPCNFVFEHVTLDVMFKQFKDGHKGHMAFVHRINVEGEGDPFYETIGLVTLEDVIEEMIQAEIVDETDVFMDNRTKRRRCKPANKLQDFTAFAERHENQRIHISPQLTLATFQFLSSSVDAFRPDTVSETVLRRLLKQDVIQYIKVKGKGKKEPSTYVYTQGKPVDYFVLLLEGRVEVTVGRENLVFEAGPFTYFGVQALSQNVGVAESPTPSAMGSLQNINMDAMLRHTFVPDYSVRAITELYYLTVKRSLYLAAKRATLMEKGALSKGTTNEQFDTEVDKLSFQRLRSSSSANLPAPLPPFPPLPTPAHKLIKSTSTPSTKDDLCSTSTGYKLPSHPNVIELLQVPGQHSPAPANSWPNASDGKFSVSFADSWETAKRAKFQDPDRSPRQDFPKSLAGACSRLDLPEVDAYQCAECMRNNFWMNMNKSVLNKSIDDVKSQDIEHSRKRKKATFQADMSLLTFHALSPPTHDIDCFKTEEKKPKTDTNRAKNDTDGCDTNTDSKEKDVKIISINNNSKKRTKIDDSNKNSSYDKANSSKSTNETLLDSFFNNSNIANETSSIDDREFEKDTVDYTMDWKKERLLLERSRIDREEEVRKQLSKILKILEMKDQT